jgi:hypothetical protein
MFMGEVILFAKKAFGTAAGPKSEHLRQPLMSVRAGDEFLELDAPMVAKVPPFGILPEIDGRYFGYVS